MGEKVWGMDAEILHWGDTEGDGTFEVDVEVGFKVVLGKGGIENSGDYFPERLKHSQLYLIQHLINLRVLATTATYNTLLYLPTALDP